MPSDLTAAVEAAKTVQVQQIATALLDLTSQPLYRRRKDVAKWKQISEFEWQWRSYFGPIYTVGFAGGYWWWLVMAIKTQCESAEAGKAACEEHFWAELERDVVERV